MAPTFTKWLSRIIPTGMGAGTAAIGLTAVAVIVGLAAAAPLVTPYDPARGVGPPLQPPSDDHLMGTNRLGYDVFSRMVYGGRVILAVVLLSTAISFAAGVPLGLLSGFRGGILDRFSSMIMDSIYAFPGLILAIAIAAVIGPGIVNTAVAIAIVYIPTYFRMVRGQVLSVKEQLFVEAAKAAGANDISIMYRYILPNVLPSLMVIFSLTVADAVLTEAGLSFLGLSVTAPTPDWGYDLRAGQPFLPSGYWWLITFPGGMIILLVIGFSLLGEGLSEMFNPRSTR